MASSPVLSPSTYVLSMIGRALRNQEVLAGKLKHFGVLKMYKSFVKGNLGCPTMLISNKSFPNLDRNNSNKQVGVWHCNATTSHFKMVAPQASQA